MEVLSPHSLFMQIVVTAERLKEHACQEFFKPLGLSATTFKILHLLSAHSGMTPTQLTQGLGCTKSNLTQRLDHLEKNGYLVRIRPTAKGDGRTVRIALTDAGHLKVNEAIQTLRKNGALLEKHFSDTERKACHDFMKKVNHILDPHDHPSSCLHR